MALARPHGRNQNAAEGRAFASPGRLGDSLRRAEGLGTFQHPVILKAQGAVTRGWKRRLTRKLEKR
jgi:hypothetical protein